MLVWNTRSIVIFATFLVSTIIRHDATVVVSAWQSAPNSDRCDRKGFLQKATTAAALLGTTTAAVTTTSFMGVTNVEAAEPLITASLPQQTTSTSTRRNSSNNNSNKIYKPLPNSLTGTVHVITGASTGLGLESAKRLAAGGATIVLTARTQLKGERAVKDVQNYLEAQSIENSEIYYLTLDLDDLSSVKSFPNRYNQTMGGKKIDVLMNNAGVAAIPKREVTKDGLERTFQSNHLGPFVLTAMLFPYLNRDGTARIINVSSIAHQFAKSVGPKGKQGLDITNLNSDLEYVNEGWGAYGNTKLMNILFTQELQQRADDAGLTWLTVVALHPGVVGTDIWKTTYFGTKEQLNNEKRRGVSPSSIASTLFYNNILTTEEGANTQVWLAANFGDKRNAAVAKGQYYDENQTIKKLAPFAQDRDTAKRLWEESEKISGIKFPLDL